MEELIKLMDEFEKRNNLSITLEILSNGESVVREFWDGEELNTSLTIKDLYTFLKETNYKLDKDGRCFSPVKTSKQFKY